MELKELCKVKPATLVYSEQKPLRRFCNLWLHWRCALGHSGLSSALGGFCCPPRHNSKAKVPYSTLDRSQHWVASVAHPDIMVRLRYYILIC